MKTPTWNPIKLEPKDGFDITLSFEEEQETSTHHFFITLDWSKDDYRDISTNYWFCAKVSVSVGGIEFGNYYLGCCVYECLEEVVDTKLDGYLPQMIEEALKEAKDSEQYKELVKHFKGA